MEEGTDVFTFTYTRRYRSQRYPDNIPVTKTMPVREEPYFQARLFPFFERFAGDHYEGLASGRVRPDGLAARLL